MVEVLAALQVVARLLIDLSEQTVYAFDASDRLVFKALVSSGAPSTPSPTGRFRVASKYADTPMRGRGYYLPSVRHVMCLSGGGLSPDAVCLHPAPWQEDAGQPFGVPRSHGCIRTSTSTARWLFQRTAIGTPVTIQP